MTSTVGREGTSRSVAVPILTLPLGGRPMAGLLVLVQAIGVRIPAPQPPARHYPAVVLPRRLSRLAAVTIAHTPSRSRKPQFWLVAASTASTAEPIRLRIR